SLVIRGEIGRTLLDLATATRADRLRVGRDLLARAGELLATIRSSSPAAHDAAASSRPARGRKGAAGRGSAPAGSAPAPPGGGSTDATPADGQAESGSPAARIPAAERRAAALALVAIWRDVARDLALVALGEAAGIRQLDLLDDLEAAIDRLPVSFAAAQLRRLEVAGERLEGNVSPELVIDALAIGWGA
ncbi:MAG: hypothetical protein ACAH65_00125, partial [Chloroflexota bacterium]